MKVDVDLQHDVQEELVWEPSVDAAQIGVTAKDGIVTLTGHVPVYAEKLAAEEVAKRVHGVKAVANDIEVRPTESHARDDADIAAAAVHAVEWSVKAPHEDVQITVQEGWIKLEGTVEWQFEKRAIERAVHHLAGVHGVTNAIRVQPHARHRGESGAVKDCIEAALRRSAILSARNISVEMEHEVVTLTGDVHTHAERDEAARIAWSAGGIHGVENCVTITPWGSGPSEEWGY